MTNFNVPDRLIGFNLFDEDGQRFESVVDVELPSLEYMMETLNGAGIAGESDMPAIGQLGTLNTTISLRTPTGELALFSEPRGHMVLIKGAMQLYEAGTGRLVPAPVSATMRCLPSKSNVGKFETGKRTDSSVELVVDYYKLEIAGKVLHEVDKLNYKCVINGVDTLEEVRQMIGM